MLSLVSILSLLSLGSPSEASLTNAAANSQQGDYIVLYYEPNYRGVPRNFNVATSNVHIDRSARRVSSVTIGRGVWQLCENPNFSGRCITLDKSVPNLAVHNLRRVRSVRPIRRPAPPSDWYIVVFELPNYRGSPTNYRHAVPQTGGNQTVRSVTIGRGVWEVCEGANYTGHCATLSRSVADLRGHGFSGRVRSLRPVSRQPR